MNNQQAIKTKNAEDCEKSENTIIQETKKVAQMQIQQMLKYKKNIQRQIQQMSKLENTVSQQIIQSQINYIKEIQKSIQNAMIQQSFIDLNSANQYISQNQRVIDKEWKQIKQNNKIIRQDASQFKQIQNQKTVKFKAECTPKPSKGIIYIIKKSLGYLSEPQLSEQKQLQESLLQLSRENSYQKNKASRQEHQFLQFNLSETGYSFPAKKSD